MTHRKTKPQSRSVKTAAVEEFNSAALLPEVVALLALAAPRQPKPAARLKQALLAGIRAGRAVAPSKPVVSQGPAAPAGWRFESVKAAEGWLVAMPGIRFKPLSVDAARDVALVLVELAPGSQFPDHPHAESPEEFLVISGDLRSGGRVLGAGDYYYAAVGTEHTDVVSPSGCTALMSIRATVWEEFRASLAA